MCLPTGVTGALIVSQKKRQGRRRNAFSLAAIDPEGTAPRPIGSGRRRVLTAESLTTSFSTRPGQVSYTSRSITLSPAEHGASMFGYEFEKVRWGTLPWHIRFNVILALSA